MKIYAIKDVKAGFGKPFLGHDNESIVREFALSCNSKPGFEKELLVKDYELYVLGEFEELTGKITATDPVLLTRGIDCLVDSKSISVEDVNAEYEKLKMTFNTLSTQLADKIKTLDSQVVSKVASMANNLSQQNKIKKILRGG
ncbi:MAG: hypothetical protein E7374_02890 [Clostridiales bacterium]|nr:hypothetical protein [Clostridiales bacterium]